MIATLIAAVGARRRERHVASRTPEGIRSARASSCVDRARGVRPDRLRCRHIGDGNRDGEPAQVDAALVAPENLVAYYPMELLTTIGENQRVDDTTGHGHDGLCDITAQRCPASRAASTATGFASRRTRSRGPLDRRARAAERVHDRSLDAARGGPWPEHPLVCGDQAVRRGAVQQRVDDLRAVGSDAVVLHGRQLAAEPDRDDGDRLDRQLAPRRDPLERDQQGHLRRWREDHARSLRATDFDGESIWIGGDLDAAHRPICSTGCWMTSAIYDRALLESELRALAE